MRVAVVHNEIADGERDPATLDVLAQAEYVGKALSAAGHEWRRFSFGADPTKVVQELDAFHTERIFNLVESVGGNSAAHPWAAGFWEILGIRYTGSPASALATTTDKVLTKLVLRGGGISTPPWAMCDEAEEAWRSVPGPWIVKPICEDGSIGIDESSVARDPESLCRKARALAERLGGNRALVEHYVEGREFNVSILASPAGVRVLPPEEIVFADYPPGKERVVGYRAKWKARSFEYRHTVQRFDFPTEDAELLDRLRETARCCWRLFALRGYARVDARVDEQGLPWVLEVNANPCLSPDAGFAAAVAKASMSPAEMADCILGDA
ncbi:MAG: ATP-grasp domain-containing protein [Planctomycetota bacterium]